ncbi:hypothetical protein [Neptunomonas sp.]
MTNAAAIPPVLAKLLNKYESGIHGSPLGKLVQLAEALRTAINYLITG